MKKVVVRLYNIICKTIFLFFILEFSLSIIFFIKDHITPDKKLNNIIASGIYTDKKIGEEIQKEALNLELEWAPFLSYKLKSFKGKHNTIDSFGRRKTFQPKQVDSTPFKIFCFGGSTMYGVGARDFYTIPSELSKLIDKQFPNKNIEIINFGSFGYSRNTENILLQQELLKNNIPDLVIFYDGVNEVNVPYISGSTRVPLGAKNRIYEYEIMFNKSKQIRSLYLSSNIKRFVNFIQHKIFEPEPINTQDIIRNLPKKIVDNFKQNIELTHSLKKHYKFKVFNFLQPVIFTKTNLSDFEKNIINQNDHYKRLFEIAYQKILQDTSFTQNSSFKDISHVFNNSKNPIYTDFCHTGEYANKLVAKEIFETIKNALK